MCDAVLKGDAAPVNALPSWAFGRPSQRLHRYGLGLGLLGVGGEGCADDILRLDGPLLSGARCAIGRPRRVAAIHRLRIQTFAPPLPEARGRGPGEIGRASGGET